MITAQETADKLRLFFFVSIKTFIGETVWSFHLLYCSTWEPFCKLCPYKLSFSKSSSLPNASTLLLLIMAFLFLFLTEAVLKIQQKMYRTLLLYCWWQKSTKQSHGFAQNVWITDPVTKMEIDSYQLWLPKKNDWAGCFHSKVINSFMWKEEQRIKYLLRLK